MPKVETIQTAGMIAVNIPECPVCMEHMTIPIFQCKSGHSLCNNCTKNLVPPLCPICRQDMTQIRNWQLEEIIAKVKIPCKNKSLGCIYTMEASELSNHMKECIFRVMDCPLGVVFGKCSWNGQLKGMYDHFKERHPNNCDLNPDAEVELENVNLKEDERFMYLLSQQNKFLFVMTVKIDTLQKMAYWIVQHIGSKNAAQQYIYEIHVTSKKNNKRKFVYIENCFNDALKTDEVVRLGKCAMIPLEALTHFVKDNKLAFRFFIKRMGPPPPKGKHDNKGSGPGPSNGKPGGENKPPAKGPKPQGGKGPGPTFKKPQKAA